MGITAERKRQREMKHMALTWGINGEGSSSSSSSSSSSLGSYAVELLWVFTLSMLVETLSHARLLKNNMNNVAAAILQTAMYGMRTGLAYLVMLSVMSLDGFVLLVAVAGYSLGFLLFGSRLFQKSALDYQTSPTATDIPPLNC